MTEGHGELAFFSVRPSNISVLAPAGVEEKIRRLTQLISALPGLEIVCADARENFSANRAYLERRIAEEKEEKIRELLKKDAAFLEGIQFRTSTAREFLLLARLRESGAEAAAALNRMEKTASDQGFECARLGRDGVRRLLARYFGSDAPGGEPGCTDGEEAVREWISRRR